MHEDIKPKEARPAQPRIDQVLAQRFSVATTQAMMMLPSTIREPACQLPGLHRVSEGGERKNGDKDAHVVEPTTATNGIRCPLLAKAFAM